MSRVTVAPVALAALAILSAPGCSSTPTPAAAKPVADFTLMDVNPSSPTTGQAVSVRKLDRISAWYFTHAT